MAAQAPRADTSTVRYSVPMENFDVFSQKVRSVTRGVTAAPTLQRSDFGSMGARATLISQVLKRDNYGYAPQF